MNGEDHFEVEDILDHRPGKRGSRSRYLVKWLGYGMEYNSWEPVSNLRHSVQLIQKYHDRMGLGFRRAEPASGDTNAPVRLGVSDRSELKVKGRKEHSASRALRRRTPCRSAA